MNRGDHVDVTEPGIAPWSGVVKALKFTPKHGTFVEIERDDTDHECYVIQEAHVVTGASSPTGDTIAEPQAETVGAGDTPASRGVHSGSAMAGPEPRSDRSAA